MEFSMQLAVSHPARLRAAMAPLARLLVELLDAAVTAGAIKVADTRRTALLMEQTVQWSWMVNRIVENPRMRITADETWDFCLHGLRG
jgi:hypothetical protein